MKSNLAYASSELADVLRDRFSGKLGERVEDRHNRDRVIVGVFESMNELLDATTQPANGESVRQYWGSQRSGWYGLDDEFVGRRVSVKAVAEIIGGGWMRGTDRLVKALGGMEDIQAKPKSIRRVRRWQDQGDTVEMPRVYAGRLDVAWQACYREQRVGPQKVTLVCDALESGGSSSDSLFWRGAAIVALADKLQTAGYNVEVVSAWAGRAEGDHVVCHVTVKKSDQPLDITTLASAVACPAFFRCIGHCWGNMMQRGRTGGYSVDVWKPAPGEIMASHNQRWSATSAREWVAEQIRKFDEGKE